MGYVADMIPNPRTVRTVLFVDPDTHHIFLDDTREFHLGQIDGKLIFTTNPNVENLGTLNITNIVRISPWSDIWANMKTDSALREDLLSPLRTSQSILEYISRRNILFSIRSVPFDEFPRGAWLDTDRVQNSDRLRWDLDNTQYNLMIRDNQYTLRNANGDYSSCWNAYGACRLILSPQ